MERFYLGVSKKALKSQASIWPLHLYGTELKEKKEMRETEERKILWEEVESVWVSQIN